MSRWPCVPNPAARSDAIFVNHPQAPEPHELWIIIIGKRKRVVRVEPAMIGVAPLFISANLYHLEISFRWPVSASVSGRK